MQLMLRRDATRRKEGQKVVGIYCISLLNYNNNNNDDYDNPI